VDIQEAHGSTRQQLKINTDLSRGNLLWSDDLASFDGGIRGNTINAHIQIITASTSVNEKQLKSTINVC